MPAPNRGKLPLIIFGAAEDLSAWSKSGTPIVTGGQADPVGGTGAYKIDDDSATTNEFIYKIVPVTLDGTHLVAVMLKQDTAAKTVVRWHETTTPATRGEITVTWPSTVTLTNGNGKVIANLDIGSGYRLILFTVTGVVAANNNRLELRPAGNTASDTGAVIAYLRNVVVLPYPMDNAVAYTRPRDGSQRTVIASGEQDSWLVGKDRFLAGDLRWLQGGPDDNPESSGWDGEGEFAGVDVGIEYWLTQAWDSVKFLWVPDRSDATTYVEAYLAEPFEDPPAQAEQDLTRRVHVVFRSADSGKPFTGY